MINYNDLIGIPFNENGNGVDSVNCYGLLRLVYKKHGIHIPETDVSAFACQMVFESELKINLRSFWKRIDGPFSIPCGVLIESRDPRFSKHILTYIGRGRVLNVTVDHPVYVHRLSEYKNSHRIIGYYEYIGE